MGNEHNHNFAAIILAAGKGVRMKSGLPKVMHKLAGQPMIQHVLQGLGMLMPAKTVLVLAPNMESVQKAASDVSPQCRFAVQSEQKGTGHAVQCALAELGTFDGTVLVLYGDTPLITTHTIHHLIHVMESADVVVLGMQLADPTGYGRLLVDASGQLEEIIEEKDATEEQKRINLCNSGVMAVRGKHLPGLLSKLTTNNKAGEYYLTDIVALADDMGLHTRAMLADSHELMGVNSRAQLAEAEAVMQWRLRLGAMEQGVTLIAPETVFLSADTRFAPDVVVHPHVVFGAGVLVESGAEIRSYSHIEGAHIGKNAVVGPFARLRPGAKLAEESHIGNFVEIKNATLGKGAKANHLSYIGDAEVGAAANIGAGTITCNYDGVKKHKTTIGAGAFIGSNTALVAPVAVGAGAVVGAGSVITEDVPAESLAIARGEQVVKQGRAKKKAN